ncbi:MAG: hypothetical protein JWN46_2403 [Acidimicrobiales bacterium]|nr:hypothetical protein [Acidimicrobiales bacterium]
MSDLRARQQLNRGYGDSFSRGLELALVPVVFGGIGWLADRAAGTSPGFTIGLIVFGFVGIFVKMWLGYDLQMRNEEAGAVWNRKPGAPDPEAKP